MGVELDQREVQVGVALGHAAADELADDLLGDDGAVDGLGHHALGGRLLGHRLVDLGCVLHDDLERGGGRVVDLDAAGLRVDEHVHAVGLGGRPHGVEITRVIRLGRRGRQEDGAEAHGGGPLDLHHGVADVGEGNGGGGGQAGEIRPEALGDVVVVDAGVGDGELVVVGVQAEERQVRVHHTDVDTVEVEVLDDHLGVTLGHPPAGLAVARDRPSLEAGRVQPAEDARPSLDERLDLEVVLPDPAVAQVLRQAGGEEVRGLQDVPVGGDDKLLLCHGCALPARGRKISMNERARTRYSARRF